MSVHGPPRSPHQENSTLPRRSNLTARAAISKLLISAQTATGAPTVAATLSESGSGATLPAATYYAVVTESNGFGETTAVADASTVPGDSRSRPAISRNSRFRRSRAAIHRAISTWAPSTAQPAARSRSRQVGLRLHLDDVSGSRPPLPLANSYAVSPPTVNTTGLTATNSTTGVVDNKSLELLRSVKDGNLETVYQYLRQAVYDFNHGMPITFNGTVAKLRHAHVVFAMLSTLCSEMGTLVDANAGTLGNSTNIIGNATRKRTWP